MKTSSEAKAKGEREKSRGEGKETWMKANMKR
jgi:hypothetical protein